MLVGGKVTTISPLVEWQVHYPAYPSPAPSHCLSEKPGLRLVLIDISVIFMLSGLIYADHKQ